MATVIRTQAPNQALFNALGQGASNFVGGRIQAGQQQRLEQQQQQQQQAQMQDLVALSQALQGGNPQQALAGFQPQSPQGAQGLFNLTSQLAGSQGDPFTLGQGQSRFGPGGQLIATAPQQPPKQISNLEKDQLKAQTQKTVLEADKLRREAGGRLSQDEKLNISTKFRTEFNGLSKEFRDSTAAFERVKASGKDPSAAGDLALIFNFMKVLDPGSVVRESEFANAAASGAFGEKVKAAAAKVFTGERLSPVMRKDFLTRANALFKSQEGIQRKLVKRYESLSKRFSVDPQDVVTFFDTAIEPQPTGIADTVRQNLQQGVAVDGQVRTPQQEARLQELLNKRGQ